jgi:hypothetical protein
VQILEQPSLLARAVELLTDAGPDETVLASECRAPLELFRVITSRNPAPMLDTEKDPAAGPERSSVIALLPASSA